MLMKNFPRVFLAASLIAVMCSPCRADAVGELGRRVLALKAVAEKCSNPFIPRFTATSQAAAPEIAGAAFEICKKAWDEVARAIAKWVAANHPEAASKNDNEAFEAFTAARAGVKEDYVSAVTPIIFELRARAAGK